MNQPDRTIRPYHPLGGTGASSRAARKAGGARVSALPYLYRPLGKRSFGTNPDGEAKGASPRGGLVGCNKRWYGAEDGWRFLARRGDRARALGWTARDFVRPPLTEATAAIHNPTGAITIYRRRRGRSRLSPAASTLPLAWGAVIADNQLTR